MQILPSNPKSSFVTIVISGVTGSIFIKLAKNVDKILPVNNFKSDWRYSNRFRNEPIYPNFAIKLVVMATSLERDRKNGPDPSSTYKYVSFGIKKS